MTGEGSPEIWVGPVSVDGLIARVVVEGGRAISEVWRDGAWTRPGPGIGSLMEAPNTSPEELAAAGISSGRPPIDSPSDHVHKSGVVTWRDDSEEFLSWPELPTTGEIVSVSEPTLTQALDVRCTRCARWADVVHIESQAKFHIGDKTKTLLICSVLVQDSIQEIDEELRRKAREAMRDEHGI